ncbi:hypothetical protein Lal_00044769 [Lupinus albus]|uniref:Uncharacterized protein n=1 Tax=Lupinus albus TaxID=3870 RepID=A0A6A4NGB1_LUPAL|nr:hypothetical protein Lalb_Chr24g0402991 [Lupinus albus]KAF1858736.1 hypothetical protein Lal_00044769 [Lupinus albus]
MKNSASKLLKQIIAGISSMTKSKTMALKSKTNAIKARLIIFSLMKNKKFLMSSLSEKIHAVLGHNSDDHNNEDCMLEHGCNDHNMSIMVHKNNAQTQTYESLPNQSETEVVEEQQNHDDGYFRYGDDVVDDDDKYPDLTHTLFESEDLDLGGSVIDLVKNCKEEAGEEFKLENEIDQCADLFIKRFHRKMILQKQESLKRQQEILERGA